MYLFSDRARENLYTRPPGLAETFAQHLRLQPGWRSEAYGSPTEHVLLTIQRMFRPMCEKGSSKFWEDLDILEHVLFLLIPPPFSLDISGKGAKILVIQEFFLLSKNLSFPFSLYEDIGSPSCSLTSLRPQVPAPRAYPSQWTTFSLF